MKLFRKNIKIRLYWGLFLIPIFSLTSCSVLSNSQLKMVQELSVKADSIAITPSVVLTSLAEIRRDRAIFYAASLKSPPVVLKELNSSADFYLKDLIITRRADIASDLLRSYLRALKMLSSTARWSQIGVEFRSIGRGIDLSITNYNSLNWSDDIKVGGGKASGKIVGYFGESYMKMRQKKLLKEFLPVGDSLLSTSCDALIEILKSDQFKLLLSNEKSALEQDYTAYLNGIRATPAKFDLDPYREYMRLYLQLENSEKLLKRAITALRSLKRGHNKLVKEMATKKEFTVIFDELLELNDIALEVKCLIELL